MSFFNNLKRDAVNTVRGLSPSNIVGAITHPDRTIQNMMDFYGQLGRHPIRTFENTPISAALGVAPVLGPAAKLARLKTAGMIPPADAAFMDVMEAPPTSWSLPSENGFGVSQVADTQSLMNAIGRGSMGTPRWTDVLKGNDATASSLLPEGPVNMLDEGLHTPEDVFDVANTADYINPDSPDLGLLMNNHLKATQDMGIPDYALGDVPEASGLDYAHLEPNDFQALGMDSPIPPELDQFMRPYQPQVQDVSGGGLYPPDRQMGGFARAMGGVDPQQLLRAMRNDAQPSVQQRLLNMLMQRFSQQ